MTMSTVNPSGRRHLDNVLSCLVAVTKLFGLPADYEQMRRAYVVSGTMDRVSFLRAAKDLGLKARSLHYPEPVIPLDLPLPAILILKDGTHLVLMAQDEEKVALLEAVHSKQVTMRKQALADLWDGK